MLHPSRIVAVLFLSMLTYRSGAANPPAPSTQPTSMPASKPPVRDNQTPPLQISGAVVDDATGQPIPEFTVTYGDLGRIPYWQHRDSKPFAKGQFNYALPTYFDQKEYSIQVMAKGYKAAASRMIRRTEGDVKLDFRVVTPDKFAAVVRDRDGNPVAGATVRVVTPGNYFSISNGAPDTDEPLPPGDEKRVAKTDAAGHFEVDVDCEHCLIIVLHDAGFAEISTTRAALKTGAVSLQPWGTVVCDVNLAGDPAAAMPIIAKSVEKRSSNHDEANITFAAHGTTDADGHCKMTRTLPGKTVVGIYEPLDIGPRDSYWGSRIVRDIPVDVPAGGNVTVHIGGGSEVTGRFTADRQVPWKYAIAHIRRAWPEGVSAPPPIDWSDDVMRRRDFPVEVRPDGTFRATDIPPGDWRIDAMVFIEKRNAKLIHHAGDVLKRFTVPKPAANEQTQVVTLGDLPANFDVELQAGDIAPNFDAVTLDGKKLRLTDLRGKYVFLDFWATWCPPCRAELPYLKKSWQKLKNDPDVVILGLSLDRTDVPVRPFVAEHGYAWTHAIIGEKSKVAHDYGITSIPRVWLVLPDGTLASTSADKFPEQIATHRQSTAAKSPPIPKK